MKYFPDFEFAEGFFKPVSWLPGIGWNKPVWQIQLISVGIVAEDGRTYQAINEDINTDKCSDWVKKNVLTKLPPRMIHLVPNGHDKYFFAGQAPLIQNPDYKSVQQISQDIFAFVNGVPVCKTPFCKTPSVADYLDSLLKKDIRLFQEWFKVHNAAYIEDSPMVCYAQPEFYGYYGAYDWVLLCTIFGTMMDLPPNFPMYMHDLKSMLDQLAMEIAKDRYGPSFYPARLHDRVVLELKNRDDYPVQVNEHDALADAMFQKSLHDFIINVWNARELLTRKRA